MSIRFGTSGWRAVLADDFTFAGVGRGAEAGGLQVNETPIGSKFLGELINEDKIILGGEESAGLSVKGHCPEKDGILACLLAAEAVAAHGQSLTQQLEDLYASVGKLEAGRIGVRLLPELMTSLTEKLRKSPAEIGGCTVKSTNRMDGVKFISDGSWQLMPLPARSHSFASTRNHNQ